MSDLSRNVRVVFLASLPLSDPGSPDLRSAASFLRWLARMQWPTLTLGITWGILWMIAQGIVPAVIGIAVQAVADHNNIVVAWCSVAVLVLGIAQAAFGVLRHRMAVTNWINAASRTQQLVIRRATHLGSQLSRDVATGEVVAVTSTDVEKIGSAFDVAARLAGAIVAFIAVAVVLLMASPLLGSLVLIGAPILALAVAPLLGPLERRESAQRHLVGKSSELAADTVAGLRVLRGIGGEDLFVQRFRDSSQAVRAAAVQVAKVRSLLESLQVALPGALLVTVTWVGARQVAAGDITIGQLVAFYGYSAFLTIPLRTITEAAQRWTSAYVAAKRVVRVLRVERTEVESVGEFTEDSYSRSVLQDPVSGLSVRPGALTAIVCGDHETADAIALRLGGFGVDGQRVTLDGVALADLPRVTVRSTILVQDKDPVLLSGTLKQLFDVPRSGRVSPEDAIATASAEDVLSALMDTDPDVADPMHAHITERGRSLSGGQRQRIALARSLVVDPEILILDEPTSAVDAHTESRIAVSLRADRADRTTVILTSSPLMLDQADEVALVLDGRVVALGSHRTLLHADPRYRAVVTREEVNTA